MVLHLLLNLQDKANLIEYYKARIAFFYGGVADSADFENAQEDIRDKLDMAIAAKTRGEVEHFAQGSHLHPHRPMMLLGANYFKVNMAKCLVEGKFH